MNASFQIWKTTFHAIIFVEKITSVFYSLFCSFFVPEEIFVQLQGHWNVKKTIKPCTKNEENTLCWNKWRHLNWKAEFLSC